METLLPNVNTSEGCFEIGVTISTLYLLKMPLTRENTNGSY